MKKIFITGVSGFVGANLVSYFHSKEDVEVIGHGRSFEKTRQKYDGFKLTVVKEYSAELFDKLEVDCIIHLAGIAHDLSNTFVDADYFAVNFENSKQLYNEFLKSNASKFVYFSSIKAAVDKAAAIIDEEVVPDPVTPYGKSKRMAEEYMTSQELPPGKKYYILRPCMIHGPENKGNLNLLYKFVKTGVPYPLGAFQNRRSFLGSDNLSFLIEQIIRKEIETGIYNLSDTGSLSTNDVVTIIASSLSKNPRIWKFPPGLMRSLLRLIGKGHMLDKLTENMEVSNQKILKAIGQPLPISIENGLRKTIQSFHA